MSRTIPPVLSDEEIDKLGDLELARLNREHPFFKSDGTQLINTWLGELDSRIVAEAQRDADVKFYEDKLGKMAFLLDDNVVVSGPGSELHPVIGTTLEGKP